MNSLNQHIYRLQETTTPNNIPKKNATSIKPVGMKSENFHGMKNKNLAEMKSASHAHRLNTAPARRAQGRQKDSPPRAGGGYAAGSHKKEARRKPSRADGGTSST